MEQIETNEQLFAPHQIQWNRQLSQRFWDYYSGRPGKQVEYFSSCRGESLLKLAASWRVPLRTGVVLDYACGTGFLLEKLVQAGVRCAGCDFSTDSVEHVNRWLRDRRGFAGAEWIADLPSSFASDSFDAVFLVEVVEHLLDEDIDLTLSDAVRVLRPGGSLIVTTPHDEDLESAQVMCPESGCIFHPMQHVRSWTAHSLTEVFSRCGLSRTFCAPVFLPEQTWASRLRGVAMRAMRMKLPHLVYIGVKPVDGRNANNGGFDSCR